MSRQPNQGCIDLVKTCEGFYPDAYVCPAGVLTIGYGHTDDVEADQHIDIAKAEDLLREDLRGSAAAVERIIKVPLNDNQFAALVSFTFNVGSGNLAASTLCSKLNAGDYDAVPTELARWVKATDPATGKKRTLPGLVKRRASEAQLWLKPLSGKVEQGMAHQVSAVPEGEKFKVSASGGLRVRSGPGTEYEVRNRLNDGQLVFGNNRIGDWLEVDIEGDGHNDGWVHSDYLRVVPQSPGQQAQA
ncbi:glycoside hydrolase family protein [Aliiglaciecola sp. CAU 1673]|uniref:glycoside hydrolase family protein n=1 Tax=Aliiglaciecola sp. CAU 1673 TaxID=3032595 RepID=UPI0023DABDB6|nr:glycoside hydrolase family protein [Aliiglaciecola sp. CAU 1673]MDF2180117.1 glycoside hydrolase family protein [Aliiglaciecola sp. CAU 1673]